MARSDPHTIHLQRLTDGTFIDWGRNGTGEHRGYGGALWYGGEAARVMALVVKHSTPGDQPRGP